MYSEEEEYEDCKSWREDMEALDKYMDRFDRLSEDQVDYQTGNEFIKRNTDG